MTDREMIFMDRFSSIDHLSRRQLADDEIVLAALRMTPRVSCFEMEGNAAVRRAVERLAKKGVIRLRSEGYPWIVVGFKETEV